MESFTWTQQSIKTCEKLVESCLKKHNICVQRLVLCKRNRDLKDGDVSIPTGLVKAVSVEVQCAKNRQFDLKETGTRHASRKKTNRHVYEDNSDRI